MRDRARRSVCSTLARVEDKPGNVAVVIFADNICKYASSFERHFPGSVAGSPRRRLAAAIGRYFEQMIHHSKGTRPWKRGAAERLEAGETPCIVDVRPPEVHVGTCPGRSTSRSRRWARG